MQGAYDLFYELFLSPEISSWFGPIGLVIVGYFVFKKDRILGVLFFVVECLFIANYIELAATTPDYWWHIVILLFGGLFTCVLPLWDR